MKAAVFPAFLAALLTACVAAEHPPRVDDRTLNRIAPGRTTRAGVLLALGLPERTGRGERTFYYRWARSTALVIIPTPYGVPVFGHQSGEHLRIDFDAAGVVSNVAAGERTLAIPFDIPKHTGFALALPEEDAEAKRFGVARAACTVYLYVRRRGGDYFSSVDPAFLRIDRRYVGHVGADGWYYRAILPPGTHTATILDSSRARVPRLHDPLAALHEDAPEVRRGLTFRCRAGSLEFVEIAYAAFARFPALRHVDPDEGRAAIREGHLVIGPM